MEAQQPPPAGRGQLTDPMRQERLRKAQEKRKCQSCGGMARSRCNFRFCKKCCAAARNPCPIHNPAFSQPPGADQAPREQRLAQGVTSGPPAIGALKLLALYSSAYDPKWLDATAAALAAAAGLPQPESSHMSYATGYRNGNEARKGKTPVQEREEQIKHIKEIVRNYKQDVAATNEWRLDVLRQHDETKKALRVEAMDRYVQNEALLSELFLAPLQDVQDYWDGTEELSKRLENIVETEENTDDTEKTLASFRSDQNQRLGEFKSMMREVRTINDNASDLHAKIAQHSKKRSELSWVAESFEDNTLCKRGKLCETSEKDEVIRNKILEGCTNIYAL